MPVCSRCTGIYIGFLFSVLCLLVFDRKDKAKLPPKKLLYVSMAAFLVMGLDVAISSLGIYDSSNIIRFITGFMAGWFLPLIILPVANIVILKNNLNKYYLESRKKFTIWIAAASFIALLFILTYRYIVVLWSFLSIIGLVTFNSYIVLILFFSIFKKFTNSIDRTKKYLAALTAGGAFSVAMLLLLSFLRRTLF